MKRKKIHLGNLKWLKTSIKVNDIKIGPNFHCRCSLAQLHLYSIHYNGAWSLFAAFVFFVCTIYILLYGYYRFTFLFHQPYDCPTLLFHFKYLAQNDFVYDTIFKCNYILKFIFCSISMTFLFQSEIDASALEYLPER